MNIKTLTSLFFALLTAVSVSAQAPDLPGADKAAQQQLQQNANQAQQNANQLQQNGNQQLQKANTQVNQTATQAQQTAQTTAGKATGGSAALLQKAEKEVSKIATAVNNLMPDQKAKLKDLFVQIYTKKAENKTAAAGDADKLQQLNNASAFGKMKKDGLKSILSSDQFAAWKAAATKKVSSVQP